MAPNNAYEDITETEREPRVHITYEVELNGASVMKELPFVGGVLADLSGHPREAPGKLKDRRFVEIDRDSFDTVLESMKPRLALKVPNKLRDDDSKLAVELNFESLADFDPENVARQIKPLAELLEVRRQLKDLLSRTEGNDRLEELLDMVINQVSVRDKLKDEFQIESPTTAEDVANGEESGS